jgi:arylsulfatase A-like enzyme
LGLFFFALVPTAAVSAADKPNIIVFLADDLGYADIGVNGCQDIPTPHVDAIAKNGVRFTDGYAAHPVCSPSRAALMSGLYQHRFGFEHNSGPERYASPNFGMPRDVPSLAEKLKTSGYATGMVGKWHIGFKEGLRPHERGFDFHFGFLSGARSYLPNNPRELDPIVRNGTPVKDEKEYLTDAFARESVEFISRSKDKPFFLYLAFNAVHSPLEATEKYEARFPHITDKKRKTYAGMLSALDDAVGRVMAKVRELGQEENTLVLFYSDNGGPTPETSSRNDPLRGYKGQMFEGGIRVPFVMQWKGKIPAGQTYREPVMGFDCHATALAAANVVVSPRETNDRSRSDRATLDGVNLLPFVTGAQSGRPHEQLFWRAGPQHAVRIGDWKLVDSRTASPMLFNLRDDIGEQHDLAASHPDKLQELQAAFAEWEKGTQPAKWVRQDQRNAEPGGKLKSDAGPGTTPRRTPNAARIDEAFKNADKNNDGRLSRDEYPQPGIFNTVDANQDSFATLEEVRAYFRNRQSNNPKE